MGEAVEHFTDFTPHEFGVFLDGMLPEGWSEILAFDICDGVKYGRAVEQAMNRPTISFVGCDGSTAMNVNPNIWMVII